jgi:hypothetical protein
MRPPNVANDSRCLSDIIEEFNNTLLWVSCRYLSVYATCSPVSYILQYTIYYYLLRTCMYEIYVWCCAVLLLMCRPYTRIMHAWAWPGTKRWVMSDSPSPEQTACMWGCHVPPNRIIKPSMEQQASQTRACRCTMGQWAMQHVLPADFCSGPVLNAASACMPPPIQVAPSSSSCCCV